jgi:AAA domain, putative AbiEii toxin, Type IV TA system
MLKRLHLENVGPASQMDVEFADRLNVLTGDNGLGKTFLLDVAWWLLANQGEKPFPKQQALSRPKIDFTITRSKNHEQVLESHKLEFMPRQQGWFGNPILSLGPDIVLGIYARLDGGFSIIDSLKTAVLDSASELELSTVFNPSSLVLSADQSWNGLKNNDVVLCNGLLQDLVKWQNQSNKSNFELLWEVLEKLLPTDEKIFPGETIRLSFQDVRDIPTIQLAYGIVPVTHLSAGMKRILTLAYSLVWAWSEHQQVARLANVESAKKLLLFVDEMELHLHPQWQRSIFPAILEAIKLLDPDLKVQVLTTTHSPLVLASLEPYFDEATDKLFGFDLVDREVVLEEMPWVKLGEVDDWLTSPIFGLSRPRSKEAEVAIEAAFALMRNADMSSFAANLQTQDSIHQTLLGLLPDDDAFWDRWIVTGRMPIAQG